MTSGRRLRRKRMGYETYFPTSKKSEGNTRLSDPYHGSDGPLHVEDRRYSLS